MLLNSHSCFRRFEQRIPHRIGIAKSVPGMVEAMDACARNHS